MSRAQEQAARADRVRQAASQLFAEGGYAATTIPAIAQAAGVSVGTVNNCGDKDTLFLETSEQFATAQMLSAIGQVSNAASLGLSERVWRVCELALTGVTSDRQGIRDYLVAFLRAGDNTDNTTRIASVLDRFTALWCVHGHVEDPETARLAAATVYAVLNSAVFALAAGATPESDTLALVQAVVVQQCRPFEVTR